MQPDACIVMVLTSKTVLLWPCAQMFKRGWVTTCMKHDSVLPQINLVKLLIKYESTGTKVSFRTVCPKSALVIHKTHQPT